MGPNRIHARVEADDLFALVFHLANNTLSVNILLHIEDVDVPLTEADRHTLDAGRFPAGRLRDDLFLVLVLLLEEIFGLCIDYLGQVGNPVKTIQA